MNLQPSTSFWQNKRITVTGGSGFLGSFVVEQLRARGATDIFIPRRADYDIRTREGIDRLLADATPDMIIHLAALAGGIGANRARPAEFFYDNLMMGVPLLHRAWETGVEKFVAVGTVCSYPKFTPLPFKEETLWDGYPEETNAPYGLAKKMLLVQAQAYREQYGYNTIYLMPVNLYGPCFSGDTEILTPEGVKNIKGIFIGDKVYTLNPESFEIEISSVIAIQQTLTDEFFNFKSNLVDFRVTPDHKIFYRTSTGYQKRRADYFRDRAGKEYGQIILAHHHPYCGNIAPQSSFSLENYIDAEHLVYQQTQTVRDYKHSHSKHFPYVYNLHDWVEFLGWYISEGSISESIGQIRITQIAGPSDENRQKIYTLLERMAIPFGYDDSAFYFTSRLFCNYIRAEIGIGSSNKSIPKFIFGENYPNSLRHLLFQTLMLGDGHKDRPRYVTKSDYLKNDFLHLCFLLGYKTNVYSGKDNCWRINIRNTKRNPTIKYKNMYIESVDAEEAYCITTRENHIVFAGRNGKLNWIGQCDNFDLESAHVIPTLIRKCLEAQDRGDDHIIAWGDGSPTREFLYAPDAAAGIVTAAEHYNGSDPVNLGSGQEISIKDLLETIARLTGFEGNIIWDTSKPNGQPRRALDTSRAANYFGWRAATGFEEGLKETIAWYWENKLKVAS